MFVMPPIRCSFQAPFTSASATASFLDPRVMNPPAVQFPAELQVRDVRTAFQGSGWAADQVRPGAPEQPQASKPRHAEAIAISQPPGRSSAGESNRFI